MQRIFSSCAATVKNPLVRSIACSQRQLQRSQQRLRPSAIRCMAALSSGGRNQDPAFRIRYTKIWLEDWVYRHALCPWAQRVQEQTRLVDVPELEADAQVMQEVHALTDPAATHQTTLVLATHEKYKDFMEFLTLHQRLEEALVEKGLDEKVQIATFHPDYVFAESEGPEDPSNATNKSPYPTLHLLRSDDVWQAIEEYKYQTDLIWKRNILKMIHLGDRRISMRMKAMRERAETEATTNAPEQCPASVKRRGRKKKVQTEEEAQAQDAAIAEK